MKKVLVLGGGMIGRAISLDLANRHHVTVADISKNTLATIPSSGSIKTLLLDCKDGKAVKGSVDGFDLAICAVPGFLGFKVLEMLIEAKIDVVDISFSPENTLDLDSLAVENNVTAVVDMGVAPGLGNLILGYHDASMEVNFFECLVGGLPTLRSFPFEYKAPFSPVDVMEIYLRPARLFENGCVVTKPALSDPEQVEFKEIGTLESFNTDGLRSLLFTMKHISNMREKTLRYPGHRDRIMSLLAAGFLSEKPLDINGSHISPLEFTSKILFDSWSLDPKEDEFTAMKITVKGETESHIWELLDRTDHTTQTSSMARTTGYTCCAVAELVLAKKWQRAGVSPGELVGRQEGVFDFVRHFLEERKINLTHHTSTA
jgi:lysine 6-dehydrogenase